MIRPCSKEIKHSILLFNGLSVFSNLSADLAIWSFYFISYCQLSLAEATMLHALIFGVIAFTDLPTGTWADRFGRKLIYGLSLVFRLAGAVLTILSPNIYGLISAAILTGLGWAFSSGSFEAFLYDNLKAKNQEEMYPVVFANCLSFQFVARTFAFGVSGFLFEINPIYPYLLLIIGMGLAIITLGLIRECPYEKSTTHNLRQQIKEALNLIFRKRVLQFLIVLFVIIDIASNGLSWMGLQPILSDSGLSPSTVGMGYSIGGLGSLLGAQLAKWFVNNARQKMGYISFALFFLLGNFLLASSHNVRDIYLGFFAISVGFGLSWPLNSSILNPFIPSSHRATCLSIVSTINYFFSWIVGSSVGSVIIIFGSSKIPLLSNFLMLCVLPLILYIVPRALIEKDTAGS